MENTATPGIELLYEIKGLLHCVTTVNDDRKTAGFGHPQLGYERFRLDIGRFCIAVIVQTTLANGDHCMRLTEKIEFAQGARKGIA